jgi:hypothetical protein
MCEIRNPPEALSNVGANAFFGGVTAACIAINPIAGAVFGVVAGLTYSLIDQATSPCCEDSPLLKVIRVILTVVASILMGVALTAALGFTITVQAALMLTVSMVATTILITTLFQCCFQLRQHAS